MFLSKIWLFLVALAAAIALQLLFFVAAYVITPHDVEWHVRWSWERIVDQLAAPATFLALVVVTRRLDTQDPLY